MSNIILTTPTVLDDLGLSYAIPRPKCPDRPDNAEEILNECVEYAFDEDAHPHNKRESDEDEEDEWHTDDDICTDGGAVVGFSIFRIRNRGTIRSGCTRSTTHPSPGLW